MSRYNGWRQASCPVGSPDYDPRFDPDEDYDNWECAQDERAEREHDDYL